MRDTAGKLIDMPDIRVPVADAGSISIGNRVNLGTGPYPTVMYSLALRDGSGPCSTLHFA